MKIKILIDDPETRAVWEAAQRAKQEVADWPAWKRGDQPEASTPPRGNSATKPGRTTASTR